MPESAKHAKPTKEQLEKIRAEMLKLAGLDPESAFIPDIDPDYERICRYCHTPGPCTPPTLACSGCGNNLAGSPRSKRSNSFNPNAY